MRKFWKIVKYVIKAVIVVFVLDAAIIIFFAIYRPTIQKADAIVVLGAAINTPALFNRSLEGLRLYEQGKAKVVVVSGGQDFAGAQTEAEYIEAVIQTTATKPVPIIIEDQSHSTYDNIKNTKAKFGGHAGSLIIVSDSFHLARAVLIAKRLGFGPVYWSSPASYNFNQRDLAFYYFREVFAMLDYIPKFIRG